MENKDEIALNSEKSLSDDSSSNQEINKKKEKFVCDYSIFLSSVVKVHVSIIFLIYALVFSHSQTLRNKNLKDEEISENDYYLGLVYIITLITSFIIGVNAYFTLSRDYEEIKAEDIFENNFMKSKLIIYNFK